MTTRCCVACGGKSEMDFLEYEDWDRFDPPEDDTDTFCPMCGSPPCRHSEPPAAPPSHTEQDQ